VSTAVVTDRRVVVCANGHRIMLGGHALARFQQRGRRLYVGGQLDNDVLAMDLLQRKARRAGLRVRRPGWLHRTGDLDHCYLTAGYLVIDGAVAFPVQRFGGQLIATTCLVRGWEPEGGPR
jgi:hypothetical protein